MAGPFVSLLGSVTSKAARLTRLRAARRVQYFISRGHALAYDVGGKAAKRIGEAPLLVLTTRGRKTGKLRALPLIYVSDDPLAVIASNGGSRHHPAWYLNLRDDPNVEVKIETERFTAIAEEAEGKERERLWRRAVEIYPPYERYQKQTGRQIPVVVLRREPDVAQGT